MRKQFIDISGQELYTPERFVANLKKLRRMFFDISATARHDVYDINQFCEDLFTLNWLIEDIAIIGKAGEQPSEHPAELSQDIFC